MEEMDEELKRLMDGLYKMDMHECVDIVITSDHGRSAPS